MGFGALTDKQRQDLYVRYQRGEDLAAEAQALGIRLNSLERSLRLWAAKLVAQSPKPRFDSPLELWGPALIIADPHCPYHDADFINEAIALAKRGKAKFCVIPGDLFDCNSFSPFDPNAKDLLEEDLAAAQQLVEALLQNFQQVVWLMGNHEGRLFRRLGFHQLEHERAKRLVSTLDAFVVSPYYQCRVNGWLVCHPKNIASTGGKVASRLATKHACNVVAGHGHLFGLSQDDSGRYIGIDSGCCADPLRLEYNAVRPNTRPAMVQGAVLLTQSKVALLSPIVTIDVEAPGGS